MTLEKLNELLPLHVAGSLATVDEGKADVRGWEVQMIADNRIYFNTGSYKPVYKQLQKNPSISFCCEGNEGYYFRISGDVKFTEDKEIVDKIYDNLSDAARGVFPNGVADGFVVFYLESGTIKYTKDIEEFHTVSF